MSMIFHYLSLIMYSGFLLAYYIPRVNYFMNIMNSFTDFRSKTINMTMNYFISDDNYDLNVYSANFKNKPKIVSKSKLGI